MILTQIFIHLIIKFVSHSSAHNICFHARIMHFSGVDENGCILLKYKSGAMANLTYHTDAGLGSNKGIVMGPQGSVEVNRGQPMRC